MGSGARRFIESDDGTYTHLVSIAEITSKEMRMGKDYSEAVARVSSLTRIVIPTLDDSVMAGVIHAGMRKKVPNFSLADAFVLQLARKLRGRVVTGDADFKGLEEAEFLK